MTDMSAWLGWSTSADAAEWLAQADRTDNIALLVGLRGASVVLVRGATALAAQNMIIVPAAASSTSSEAGKDSGTAAREQVLLVGESSLNVRRGDRFSYGAGAGDVGRTVGSAGGGGDLPAEAGAVGQTGRGAGADGGGVGAGGPR